MEEKNERNSELSMAESTILQLGYKKEVEDFSKNVPKVYYSNFYCLYFKFKKTTRISTELKIHRGMLPSLPLYVYCVIQFKYCVTRVKTVG